MRQRSIASALPITTREVNRAAAAAFGAPVEVTQVSLEPIVHGAINPVTLGVYRVAIDGVSMGKKLTLHLILKQLQSRAGLRTTRHFNYWKREAEVYRSGILETLGDVGAPACYGVSVHRRQASVWLEDVSDGAKSRWQMADYDRGAATLGRLNGAFTRTVNQPRQRWLSRHWFHEWAALLVPLSRAQLRPLARVLPVELRERFAHFFSGIDALVRSSEALPQTLCHLDGWRDNLFLTARGVRLIDWAFLGIAPVGADIGQLYSLSLLWRRVPLAQAERLEAAVMRGYREGLRTSNATVRQQDVERGFAITAALRQLCFTPYYLAVMLKSPASMARHSFGLTRAGARNHLIEFSLEMFSMLDRAAPR